MTHQQNIIERMPNSYKNATPGKSTADRRVLANEKIPDFLSPFGIFFFSRQCKSGRNVAYQSPSRECDVASSEFTVLRDRSLITFHVKAMSAKSEVWISFLYFPANLPIEK